MSFVTVGFIVFLIAITVVYYSIPKKFQWIWLLIVSLGFYATYGKIHFTFLFFASLITYFFARWIEKKNDALALYLKEHEVSREEKKELMQKNKKACKKILITGVILLLSMLIYTKTAKWILALLANLTAKQGMPDMRVIVVLGISYYTFSAIGYLADVYWKKEKAEKNYFRLLLFLVFFPKILQGPIAKHKNLAPMLFAEHPFDYNRLCFGMQLMLYGYFKKMVIADRLAPFVSEVFHNYTAYSGAYFALAAIFGTLQLYCDFSGCMDIAIGFSNALGIELEPNFNRPFFSASAAEFWRRWHITLGVWFKDYVYMPLVISPSVMKLAQKGKKRFGDRFGKALVQVIPLSAVWLLTGIWHGTGLNYVVWGIYWGIIIIISTIFEPEIRKVTAFLKINTEAYSFRLFQMVRTFLFFSIGRIITIPSSLRASGYILKEILLDFKPSVFIDGSLFELGINRLNFIVVLVSIFVLWAVGMMQEHFHIREELAKCNLLFRWMIYILALVVVLVFGIYGSGYDAGSFVYMNY